MYYEVIPIKLFRGDAGILTYSSDLALKPGTLVKIPLGKLHTFGIIIQKIPKPAFAVKSITSVLYDTPLPAHLLKSIHWLSEYYLTPLPTIANLVLPKGLGTVRRRPKSPSAPPSEKPLKVPLNRAQHEALKALKTLKTPTKLLHGVTGSGKTNIYLTLAAETLAAKKSVILLVPEIALTSQLVQIFERTFPGKTVLLHSAQTEATRHLLWEQLLAAASPRIVIGPRSALFAPLKDLGLIVIDEAHESAYFQENPPRYSALRLASFIASDLKITCLQGTATPLVADYYLAKKRRAVVSLTRKAKPAHPPEITVVDLKDRANFEKSRYFSRPLLAKIAENLNHGHQTLIYHNRRGSAPLTLCENCGWQALCPTCFLPLTLHADAYCLICHTCGRVEKVPAACPDCRTPGIIHKGFGTKLLEMELKNLFPEAKIARFDADNRTSEALHSRYDELKDGSLDLLIGTQTVAKGLDLPLLATVGVIQADAGLSLPDYSAEERTFELLTQVLGRIGRGHLEKTSAVIQTYHPSSPVLAAAINSDYEKFYAYLLKKRQKSRFPPFSYLARVSVTYKTEDTALRHVKDLRSTLVKQGLAVSRPTPAFHERTARGYTWQLTLKSSSRKTLLNALRFLPKNANTHLTLDPPSLL